MLPNQQSGLIGHGPATLSGFRSSATKDEGLGETSFPAAEERLKRLSITWIGA